MVDQSVEILVTNVNVETHHYFANFSDECQCSNPPSFCKDSCHSYFPMGDRYCDGIEDPAWQYINSSDCPRGFDELF